MELKEFIAAALEQVLEGIQTAQAKDDTGQNINADVGGSELGGNLVNAGSYGVVTRVDFDVLVSAETSGGGGAKLSVFGIGAEGGAQHKAGTSNRISFSVPVRLPDGDKTRAKEIHERGKARHEEHKREWQNRRL